MDLEGSYAWASGVEATHSRILPVAHSKLSAAVVWGPTYKHCEEALHAAKHQANTELTTVSTPHNRTVSLLNAD
jgi:hypothetical protein